MNSKDTFFCDLFFEVLLVPSALALAAAASQLFMCAFKAGEHIAIHSGTSITPLILRHLPLLK